MQYQYTKARLFMNPQFQKFFASSPLLPENLGIGIFTGEVDCGEFTVIRFVLEDLSLQTHRVI
jgi:hypothetical protein